MFRICLMTGWWGRFLLWDWLEQWTVRGEKAFFLLSFPTWWRPTTDQVSLHCFVCEKRETFRETCEIWQVDLRKFYVFILIGNNILIVLTFYHFPITKSLIKMRCLFLPFLCLVKCYNFSVWECVLYTLHNWDGGKWCWCSLSKAKLKYKCSV